MLTYSPSTTSERQTNPEKRHRRCHIPAISISPPTDIRRRTTRRRTRFLKNPKLLRAATYSPSHRQVAARVANSYPEVCLFSDRLRQTLQRPESARLRFLRRTAQSRLSAANLEEARPLRRQRKHTRNRSGDQPDLGSNCPSSRNVLRVSVVDSLPGIDLVTCGPRTQMITR
jgi:hypothetical protein